MKLSDVIERDIDHRMRDRGEGECVDCGANSKTYYRCFRCNQIYSKSKKQKQKEREEIVKKLDFSMIENAKLCKEKGGKCGSYICPQCSPMDGDDGPINLEFLQKKYNLI